MVKAIIFDCIGVLFYDHKVDLQLLEYIQSLKPHYKVSILSNLGSNRVLQYFTEAQIDMFDDIVLSYEVGLYKPDKRIYILAAKRLNVEPNECLIVDDNPGHCQAGQSVGMQGIVYKNFSMLKNALKSTLM